MRFVAAVCNDHCRDYYRYAAGGAWASFADNAERLRRFGEAVHVDHRGYAGFRPLYIRRVIAHP